MQTSCSFAHLLDRMVGPLKLGSGYRQRGQVSQSTPSQRRGADNCKPHAPQARAQTNPVLPPPSSHRGPVRVSSTPRPAPARAVRQALPITPNPPILSHALAARRTSGGEREEGCQQALPEEPRKKFEAK